jgi:hypothetical protein
MKRIVFILMISVCLISRGQINLVPNWSFENMISCPDYLGQLNKASPWFCAYQDTANSSTDLFSTCGSGFADVPYNLGGGYQHSKTGNSYAGFYLYMLSGSYKEYAEVRLSDSLTLGKSYCLSFYVNMANTSSCAISTIGAFFSHDSLFSLPPPFGNYTINVTPDILSDTNVIINDTLNWTRIEGIYHCTSSQNFITIGNFFDDSASTHVTCNGAPTLLYYYLDDVSVVEVSSADAGNDTAMCSGETIQIGGLPTFDADYVWYELADSTGSASIDSINIAKPHISPAQTTAYVMWKRQCNVVTMDTVIVTVNCVGIKEQNKVNILNIYPNPSSESIHIWYEGTFEAIRITDMLGKEVKQIKEADITVSDLSSGIYFVSLLGVDNSIIVAKKVVVQR